MGLGQVSVAYFWLGSVPDAVQLRLADSSCGGLGLVSESSQIFREDIGLHFGLAL